jgi:hypothetical protein
VKNKQKKPSPNGRLDNVRIESLDRTFARRVRESRSEATVEKYAELHLDGVTLPPVIVFEGGGRQFLADGEHRTEARARGQSNWVRARVFECGSEDEARRRAKLYAASANEENALQRSPGDKRAAVEMILLDPEFAKASERQVAAVCKVGRPLVAQMRRELVAAGRLEARRPAHCMFNFRGGYTMMPGGAVLPNHEAIAFVRENLDRFEPEDPLRRLVERGEPIPLPQPPEPTPERSRVVSERDTPEWKLVRKFKEGMNEAYKAGYDAIGLHPELKDFLEEFEAEALKWFERLESLVKPPTHEELVAKATATAVKGSGRARAGGRSEPGQCGLIGPLRLRDR